MINIANLSPPRTLGVLSMLRFPLAASLAALVSIALISSPVLACGGFFCSQVPVEQRGEQIVFSYGPEGVTAIIQIAYQGSAEDFAWVVPVSGQPEVALGPDAVFSELRMRTDPRFEVNWDWNDNSSCLDWGWGDDFAEGAPEPSVDGVGGQVIVLDKQVVGPFVAVTLDATSAGAELLLQWLNDNDFDQPEESLPIIDHYLEQELNFIAVKLKESATVGDLQPLMLTMPDAAEPCIPLVLTRIAAAPDMPVTAWVFGDHRIVPMNWFGVEVNPKKIDWLSQGENYEAVATEAINEAAGHGFITEFAKSFNTQNFLYAEGKYDTESLAQISDPNQFLDEMLMQGFPRNAQVQSLIQVYIPKPPEEELSEECQTDQQFYSWNLETCLDQMPADWVFDPQSFSADLEEKVVQPLKSAQEMLDRVSESDGSSYLTRLFSTVSPDEMTRDPIFEFNRDLDDVDNYHYVDGSVLCNDEDEWQLDAVTLTHGEESWTIEGPFPDGLWGMSEDSFSDPFPEESASGEIVVYAAEGPPTTIALEDVAQQEQTFEMMDPTFLPWDGDSSEPGTTEPGTTEPATTEPATTEPATTEPATTEPATTEVEDEGGCNGAEPKGTWALLAALMMGMLAIRRRQES
mgnify:CR=1 FL=1